MQAAIDKRVTLSPGVSVSYSGQFEFLERANAKLKLVIPATLMIIFVLLYLTFRRIDEALLIAERLRGLVATGCGLETDDGVQGVTLSCGVAQMFHGEQLDELTARADAALRQAKENGRDRVELAG